MFSIFSIPCCAQDDKATIFTSAGVRRRYDATPPNRSPSKDHVNQNHYPNIIQDSKLNHSIDSMLLNKRLLLLKLCSLSSFCKHLVRFLSLWMRVPVKKTNRKKFARDAGTDIWSVFASFLDNLIVFENSGRGPQVLCFDMCADAPGG